MSEGNVADSVPVFGEDTQVAEPSTPVDMSSLASIAKGNTFLDWVRILALAILVAAAGEGLLRVANIPDFVFPKPTAVALTLVQDFTSLYLTPLLQTLQSFLLGLAIGSTVGLALAVLVTQWPKLEKYIAPYIIVMVTTPMIALVPFLMLRLGFGIAPRVIAVALASGPMVMINAATGLRRTNEALVSLADSYGASTYQIFKKIRFPLALPMIIVGYMVGSIFGLLTAIGAEMVGGGSGLGNRLVFFSSLVRMPEFGAVLVIVAALGVSIYGLFTLIGNRWASWQA